MAKKNHDTPTALVDVAPAKPKPKSAAAILQNCLAQLENHPDAKLLGVSRAALRERAWYDAAIRDQEEVTIRVAIRLRTV